MTCHDLVPDPTVSLHRRDLAMTVDRFGRTASACNLLLLIGRFRLDEDEARKEIGAIVAVARQWREHFAACWIAERDIEHVASAMLPERFFV